MRTGTRTWRGTWSSVRRRCSFLTAAAQFPLGVAYYDAMEATLEALEQVGGDVSNGERRLMRALGALRLESPTGPIRLDARRQAVAPNYLNRVDRGPDRKPVTRVVRTVHNVEQTFNGYF